MGRKNLKSGKAAGGGDVLVQGNAYYHSLYNILNFDWLIYLQIASR